MRNRALGYLIPATVMAILLLGPRTARAEDWHKTYTVSGKPTVHVETNDGEIRISAWDGKQIEARIETVGWRISDGEVRVIEHQTGDRLDLEARVPNVHWNLSFSRRSLRIELRIPREADLNVHTGDGNVEIGDNIGAVTIRTGDGSIRASRVKGDIRLSTGDGRIDAIGLDGRLDASSGDGYIQIEGRLDSLNLQTSDGSIDARLLRGSRMANGWNIRTGDGNLRLQLPEDFRADLDAHTGDGHINMDFPVVASGKVSSSELRGKLNGGGPLLTAHTGDGSIHILK